MVFCSTKAKKLEKYANEWSKRKMLIKINRRPVYVVARGWPARVRILAEHLADKPLVAANSPSQFFSIPKFYIFFELAYIQARLHDQP